MSGLERMTPEQRLYVDSHRLEEFSNSAQFPVLATDYATEYQLSASAPTLGYLEPYEITPQIREYHGMPSRFQISDFVSTFRMTFPVSDIAPTNSASTWSLMANYRVNDTKYNLEADPKGAHLRPVGDEDQQLEYVLDAGMAGYFLSSVALAALKLPPNEKPESSADTEPDPETSTPLTLDQKANPILAIADTMGIIGGRAGKLSSRLISFLPLPEEDKALRIEHIEQRDMLVDSANKSTLYWLIHQANGNDTNENIHYHNKIRQAGRDEVIQYSQINHGNIAPHQLAANLVMRDEDLATAYDAFGRVREYSVTNATIMRFLAVFLNDLRYRRIGQMVQPVSMLLQDRFDAADTSA